MSELTSGKYFGIDETGKTYGRLIVLRRNGSLNGARAWLCRCECGIEITTRGASLRNGTTASCGCLNRDISRKHGMSHSPELEAHHSMMTRCYNKQCASYNGYGGRGIMVCDRWYKNASAFISDMGKRPIGYSLERIDNNKGYSPANCVWAAPKTQQRNRRTTKLNEVAVRVIRYLYANGVSGKRLSKAYSVSASTISTAVNGHTWS